jgi:predicted enzyme related to lactoylglutathione lyase
MPWRPARRLTQPPRHALTIEQKDNSMSKRDDYPPGAPCWVDTWQPDPRAALRFYGALLGWSFDEATSMPNGLGGDYFGARVAGRLVAGIGQAPASSPAVWSTYVRVGDIDQALARAEEAGGARLAGPMDAGSDGRLAVLTDATDVPFCLWPARASAPSWSTSRTPGR